MLMKFGLRIDVDLRKRVTSSNTKPEVVWSRRGRHLEIVYDVITPPRVARFGHNLVFDAEEHADYNDMVEVATGRRILIWRTFLCPNRK